MASPLGHMAAGVCIYKAMQKKVLGEKVHDRTANVLLIAATVVLSLLPDADSAFGILFGNFGRFHNNLSHSLFFGLAAAVAGAIGLRLVLKTPFRTGYLFSLTCYWVHLLLDFLTVGRGVMLFWPLTSTRFQSPVKLFYGLHWSQSAANPVHFLTLFNELAFIAVLYLGFRLLARRKGTRGQPS